MQLSVDELKKQKEQLIHTLQTNYPEVCAWLVDNKYDLNDFKKHTMSLAAAFVIAAGVTSTYQVKEFGELRKAQATVYNDKKLKEEHIDNLKAEYTSAEDLKAINVIENYGDYINATAQKYELDPKVIFATIMVESMGNPKAIRYEPQINDASYGLGQILYSTAKYIGFQGSTDQLYDPQTNIDLIGKYHKRTLDTYGHDLSDESLAIAYNSGNPYGKAIPGHVQKFDKWLQKAEEYKL